MISSSSPAPSSTQPRPGAARIRGKLSPLTSAVLALVLLCTVGTVLVGMELYEVTGQPTQFNTR